MQGDGVKVVFDEAGRAGRRGQAEEIKAERKARRSIFARISTALSLR